MPLADGRTVTEVLGEEAFPTCHCYVAGDVESAREQTYALAQHFADPLVASIAENGLCASAVPSVLGILYAQVLAAVVSLDPSVPQGDERPEHFVSRVELLTEELHEKIRHHTRRCRLMIAREGSCVN